MPEAGGSSTITGVDFEAWFVALKFVDAFFDENLKIKPQAKTYIDLKTKKTELASIDDVCVFSKNKEKFYNIKSNAPNRKYWTIGSLKNQKVLKQMKDQFLKNPDSKLYFVSQSPCLIFSEILERGANCNSREDLEIRLKPNDFIKKWDKLKKELNFSDDKLIKFSNKVSYIHIINTEEIKKRIEEKLYGHIYNYKSAPLCLYQLAIESGKFGKTISRENIKSYFEQYDIHLKSHLKIEELTEKLKSASENLSLYSGSMILDEPIERAEVDELINWIKEPIQKDKSQIAVITGKAGCGKTFILKDLLKNLQEEKIQVLGIKADINQYDSIKNFSDELGFSDGIKESLASIVENYGKGVVIIDQIDALSLSMGKDRKFINTYLRLISHLNSIKGIRIIISCRSFDLKFDPDLRSLENKVKEVNVKDFADTQVESILMKLDIKRNQLSETLFKLLKLPLHLKVFCDIYKPGKNISSLNTLQDLYNELWEQKITDIEANSIKNEVFESIDLIVKRMDSDKVITVPFSLLDRKNKGRNYLISESIINRQRKKIQFFHSSFFDYCYSRAFITKHASLVELVLSQEQGLFVRSQIKQVMAYLRESDAKKHLKELKELLNNPDIRFHIKLLIINQLAFLDDPSDKEWMIVKKLFDENSKLTYHFIEGIQSGKWLEFLISNGYLEKFLKSSNKKLINRIVWQLGYLVNPHIKLVVGFLIKFPDIKNKDEYISRILLNLDHWENEKAIQLFEKHKTIIKKMNSFGFYSTLEKVLLYNPDFVSHEFFNDLDKRIDSIKCHQNFDGRKFIDYEGIKIFEKLMELNPKKVIPDALKILNKLTEKTKWGLTKFEYYIDFAFLSYENFETTYDHWKFLSVAIREIKNLAINNKKQFTSSIKDYLQTRSLTMLKILIKGFNSRPESYIQEGFRLFMQKGIFEQLTNDEGFKYEIKMLLKNLYTYFSKEQKKIIKSIILSLSPKFEKRKDKGYSSSIGYSKYQLLSVIPEDDLLKDYLMKKEFFELKRKFGKVELRQPTVSRAGTVGPPLPQKAYEKMTLDQWLSSFKEYDNSTGWSSPKGDPDKGGIIQHSRIFTHQVSKQSDEFYNFIFNLGKRNDISVKYLAAGLNGLKQGKYNIKKLKKLVKTYWGKQDPEFRIEVISTVEYIDKQGKIDLELIDILKDYAINDPDPKVEKWKKENGGFDGEDPLSYGINSVRGLAAWTLGRHGFKTLYPDKLFKIFEKISEDKSIAVRCSLIVHLQGMIRWNRKRTFLIFQNLTKDFNPKVIKYGLESIYYLMSKSNFKSFIPYFKKIMNLNEQLGLKNVGNDVGQILMRAYVNQFAGSKTLLEEGFKINEEIKIGAIDFASRHLNSSNIETKEKSRKIYLKFLNDASDKVKEKYDWCFRYFKLEDFNAIYEYVYQYTKSSAIQRNSRFFFVFLEKCVRDEPEKCIDLMENYSEFETPDTKLYSIQGEPIQIIIEALNRTDNVSYKKTALNIFDSFLQQDVYKSYGLGVLKEYDRE